MKRSGLRRAVLLGLAMSLTVGTVGFAEDIDHSLIVTDTDIIYPADGSTTNEDYTITADEEHPAIELGNQGHDVFITTTGNIILKNDNGYAIAPGTTSSGTLAQDAQGSVVLNGNDISITGSGILLDYANNNGYGNDEKAVYADINASGNFVIGKEGDGNTATTGLFVDTYAGTIEVDVVKGILIDIEGDTLIGANESGHITINANENIILNATSSNTDIVMGYIENRNNQYSGYSTSDSYTLNGVNGIRNSEVKIRTKGDIYFNVQETNQNNFMNVGIFGVGSRKGNNGSPWPNPPVVEGNPETAPYLDEDGYVASQNNITEISGNKLDFSVSNSYGIATGILAQGSNKVNIDLQSVNGINFVTISEQGKGAIGLDTADGNINFTTKVGSNIIQGIAKDEGAQGIGIQTENSDSPYTYSNRITLQSGLDNTVYGTSTAVYNTGSDSIVKADADNGDNNMLSDKAIAVQAVDRSQTYLTASKGLNVIQTKNVEANAINADNSTVGLNGYQNKIVNGEYNVNAYGQGIAVLAANEADVTATAKKRNTIQGAVQSATKATVTITGDSNNIRSAAVVKDESDVDGVRTDRITSAMYAKDGGEISVTGNAMGTVEGEYNNIIATSVDASQGNDKSVMKERVVWAENGTIAIHGLTAIHASNGSVDDTNSVGIALAAGASRVEGTPEEETKPFSGVINANLADGSYIYGDMLAGNGGLLNIYKGAGAEVTTFSNGSQAIQNATIQGNALSGNGGELNLKLGENTFWTGRADDYQDADSEAWKTNHTGIFTPEFSNDVKSSGNVNVELNGAEWHVTGQSWVTKLSGNNGTIDLTKGVSATHAFHVGNLTGSHNFVINLDKQHSLSDMLYIHDVGTGEGDTNRYEQHVVISHIEGIDQIADGEKLRFATVLPGIDNLYFTGEYDGETIANDGTAVRNNMVMMRDKGVMNNAFLIKNEAYNQEDTENQEYNGEGFTEVKPGNEYIDENYGNESTNWYLQRTKAADQTSDAGKTVIAMSKVNYANAIYMDRLNKRMGEARYIDGDEGLWVRMRHDRIGKSDAFRSKNTMMELGYDKRVNDREDGEHRQGFAIDYMRGTADYDNVAGDGDVRRAGLWFYDTWLGDKGHYTDYVLKFGRLSNDFEVYARSTGEKITGDYSNFVYSASAEYGRKKALGGDWYIEPQAQIQYAHVTDADYTTSQDTHVQLDAIDSLIGRAGFRLGKDVGAKSTFYVKADVLHEFLGDQDIDARDATGRLSTTYENEGTWYDVGLGFSHQFSKGTYMFLDVEKTFGNDNEDTYQFNFGMNWKV